MVQIALDKRKIAAFCQRHGVYRLMLYGSVLRGDFRPDSDVDVMVAFLPESHPTLLDLVRMQHELEAIIGRTVDLVEQSSVERSRNYLRRNEILRSAEVVHGA